MSRKIYCLTPVKDEAWILERFLKCASLWADVIIIADQQSTDGSREIAQSFEKVHLIENMSADFNEPQRQALLIDEARRFEGDKILFALDADEIITANFMQSNEWRSALESPAGTAIHFRCANILPEFDRCWYHRQEFPWGFVDDGTEHVGRAIHSVRLPVQAGRKALVLNDVKVMHYQYTDWARMESKHRWYLAWEWLNSKRRSQLGLYRIYNHMNAFKDISYQPLDREWLTGYQEQGIDMTSVNRQGVYRWDKLVLDLMVEHGPRAFKKLPIWDFDWEARAEFLGYENSALFKDPRGYLGIRFHHWLKLTQPGSSSVKTRVMDEVLKLFGF